MMKKAKWDIVEDLGAELRETRRPGMRHFRSRVRGAIATSLVAVSLSVAAPVTSAAESHVKEVGHSAAAASPLPVPIVRISRSSISRALRNQEVDTKIGLTSRQLAVRFNAFFQPADSEPEDTSDYSFF